MWYLGNLKRITATGVVIPSIWLLSVLIDICKHCNICGKQGHLAQVCRSIGNKSTNPWKAVVRKANLLKVTTEDD